MEKVLTAGGGVVAHAALTTGVHGAGASTIIYQSTLNTHATSANVHHPQIHAASHAVGGADATLPADPGSDKFLMWDDSETALSWQAVAGGGDMLAATYDPTSIAASAFDTDNHIDGSTNGVYTLDERAKLAGIDASADATPDANTTTKGKVELAIASEINTGTDDTRANTPDALAGSNFGIRYLQAVCFDFTTDNAVGDGKMYWHIPPALNGMNLVYVHAEVITAGTTGTEDIQIHNLTDTADMLSTVLTIDTGETGSDTAATPYVINGATDDVATNDVIRVDVDVIHTTAAKGLILTLGFQLP